MSVINRKERDRKLRETDFLDAGERVFAEKGYHQASMDDVAREAQYATGTVYRYFESKEALYHALLLRRGREYFTRTQESFDAASNPVSQLRALLKGKVAFFSHNWDFLRIYLSELAQNSGAGTGCQPPEELKDEFDAYVANLRGVLVDGMQKGYFRKLDADYVLSAYMGMTNEFLNATLGREGEEASAEALEGFLFDFLGAALFTEKGKSK